MTPDRILHDLLDGAIRYSPILVMLVPMCWKLLRVLRSLERAVLGRLDAHSGILATHGRQLDMLDATLGEVRDYTVRHEAEYRAGMDRLSVVERRIDKL